MSFRINGTIKFSEEDYNLMLKDLEGAHNIYEWNDWELGFLQNIQGKLWGELTLKQKDKAIILWNKMNGETWGE
jgi:hypothetical protein